MYRVLTGKGGGKIINGGRAAKGVCAIPRLLGVCGGMLPQKIFEFVPSEIVSGVFSDSVVVLI